MSSKATPRIVVLVSGEGSNLQALIDSQHAADLGGDIVGVVSNRPRARALQRAKQAGIATTCVDHQSFSDRAGFDQALAAAIDTYAPDLLVLAGFMRILGDPFIARYLGRMLNIHPSLLPLYPGLHTHRRALEAGDREHGTTIHFVTTDLDGGPAVLQGRLPVQPEDTESTLATRVQALEHRMYPLAVRWYCAGRLVYAEGAARLDGELLPASGVRWTEEMQ